MRIETRLQDMGIVLPLNEVGPSYYGTKYGKMKPYYEYGQLLLLSGQTAGIDAEGNARFPGRVGRTISVDDARHAARQTGINCVAAIKNAVGDLDRVVGFARVLNFVACDPEFTAPHLVASAMTDFLVDVFGDEIAVAPRATIGVTSLADDYCFETWVTVEVAEPARRP
ncbi:endoribonuclease L-PSP [Caballeronia temeraria]|uniref:Endoribonuclease L-PSP n=1 Tax=Caballeronia temeraria TaxID=1777137 RepID=A0A158CNH1_9BURK|nr:RidA family protein [Caballeronia temeraria]SAK83872.1 endoribonuclease L-PSP [Caballeronia temeraria]